MGWWADRKRRRAASTLPPRATSSYAPASAPVPAVVPDPLTAGLLYGSGVYGGSHSHSDSTFADEGKVDLPEATGANEYSSRGSEPTSDYSTSGYDGGSYSTQGSSGSSDYGSSGYGSSSDSSSSSSSSSSYDSGSSSSYDSGSSSSFDSGSSSF